MFFINCKAYFAMRLQLNSQRLNTLVSNYLLNACAPGCAIHTHTLALRHTQSIRLEAEKKCRVMGRSLYTVAVHTHTHTHKPKPTILNVHFRSTKQQPGAIIRELFRVLHIYKVSPLIEIILLPDRVFFKVQKQL